MKDGDDDDDDDDDWRLRADATRDGGNSKRTTVNDHCSANARASAVMDAERDAFAASVQRDLNSVTDADRAVRRRAFDALSKRCALARDRSVDRSAARSFVRSIDETKIARASVHASSSPLTPHRPSPSRASHRRLLKGDASSPAPSPTLLRALVPVLFPSILRGLLDSVEKVREKCAQLVADVLDALPDPMVGPDGDPCDGGDLRRDDGEGATAVALPSLLPAMVKIVGTAPVEEPSEEIRLSCVELTTRAVTRATTIAGGNASGEKTATTSTLLLPFAEDVAAVVHASSGDQFHDVKRACAALVEAIARATPFGALPPASAMKMLKATLANARHRHSSVRLAVVAAVDALHRAGAVPDAAVPETLAPGTRPLCADRAPAVRAAFHKALAGWMTTSSGGGGEGVGGGGGERRGDHREDCGKVPPGLVDVETTADADDDAVKRGCALPRARWLLPMLLTGVADETEANGVAALELVRVVGEANDAALGIGGLGGEGASDEAGVDDRTAKGVLPPPFAGAPPPGARRLVRALLPSLLPLALRETKARSIHWSPYDRVRVVNADP